MSDGKTNTGEANRLYWESDRPVAEIASSLDLSRRALYEAIEPIEAGEMCEVCGGMMHYANRSARDTKQATCFVCATSSPQEPARQESEAWTWSPSFSAGEKRTAPAEETDLRARAYRLGGAALIGAVIGAAATHLLFARD